MFNIHPYKSLNKIKKKFLKLKKFLKIISRCTLSFSKDFLDVLISLILIIFLFPLVIIISILIWYKIDFQFLFKKDQG